MDTANNGSWPRARPRQQLGIGVGTENRLNDACRWRLGISLLSMKFVVLAQWHLLRSTAQIGKWSTDKWGRLTQLQSNRVVNERWSAFEEVGFSPL